VTAPNRPASSTENALALAQRAGIHRIALPTPFLVGRVNCHLIEDDPLTLIDTGPNSGKTLDDLERALAARDLLNPKPGEGAYRFLCTGAIEAFHALGTRFLQMPLGEVVHVELEARAAA